MDKKEIGAIIGIVVAVIAIIVVLLKKKSPEIPITCSVDSDCPEGYICKEGVCVAITTPPPTEPASLEGYLKAEDTGNALPLRRVELEDTELLHVLTDSNGRFHFDNLVTGSYTLVAPEGDGYGSKAITITLKAGSNRQDITLKRITAPIPVELSYLTIIPATPTLGDFVKILYNLKFLVVTEECVVETVKITKPNGDIISHSTNCCMSQTYQWQFLPDAAGAYQVKVGNLSGSFTVAAISGNLFTYDELREVIDLQPWYQARSILFAGSEGAIELIEKVIPAEAYVTDLKLVCSKDHSSLKLSGTSLTAERITFSLSLIPDAIYNEATHISLWGVYGQNEYTECDVDFEGWWEFLASHPRYTHYDKRVWEYVHRNEITGLHSVRVEAQGSFAKETNTALSPSLSGDYQVVIVCTLELPDGGGGYNSFPLYVWNIGTVKA